MAVSLKIQVYIAIIPPEKTGSSSEGQLLLGVFPSNYFCNAILIDFRGGSAEFVLEGAVKIEGIIYFEYCEGGHGVTVSVELEYLFH